MELQNEIEYYLTKLMLSDMVAKKVLTDKEYEVVKAKVKAKYTPYFDLLSD